MKIILITVCAFLLGLNSQAQGELTKQYDFDASKYVFDTPEQLVNSFIDALTEGTQDQLMMHYVPKEVYLYFLAVQADQFPTEVNKPQDIDTEALYLEFRGKFLVSTNNLRWQMKQDGVELEKAGISKIDIEIRDSQITEEIKFATAFVELESLGNPLELQIRLLAKFKEKWFIFMPSFYWNEEAISRTHPVEQQETQENANENARESVLEALEEIERQEKEKELEKPQRQDQK